MDKENPSASSKSEKNETLSKKVRKDKNDAAPHTESPAGGAQVKQGEVRQQQGNRGAPAYGSTFNILEHIPPEAVKTIKLVKKTPPQKQPAPVQWTRLKERPAATPDIEEAKHKGPLPSWQEEDEFRPKRKHADNPTSEASFPNRLEPKRVVEGKVLSPREKDDPKVKSQRKPGALPAKESHTRQEDKSLLPKIETEIPPETKPTLKKTVPSSGPKSTKPQPEPTTELKDKSDPPSKPQKKSIKPIKHVDKKPKVAALKMEPTAPDEDATLTEAGDSVSDLAPSHVESDLSLSSLNSDLESLGSDVQETESSVDPDSTMLPNATTVDPTTTDHQSSPKPPTRPIASKVIYFKPPEPSEALPPSPDEPFDSDEGPATVPEKPAKFIPKKRSTPLYAGHGGTVPLYLFPDSIERILKENEEDKDVDDRLNDLISDYRGDQLKKLKDAARARAPKYKYKDMMKTLKGLGIPCPTNEDFAVLHGSHSRWDPDGTVVEYFSPMLRSFVPVNMRGRYRGSWPTDTCMKGLDISNIPPKRDALEGFVERGRHDNIQQKYDEMSEVAVDETHLDYLIEMQAFQVETMPIPIFYDMLHLGMQVANESLRILVQEEGYSPNNKIFRSQLQHAEQIRRKIQLYGALGLETLDSKRRGLGEYIPHWLKSRDELVRDVMATLDATRFQKLRKKETEGKERETARWQQKRMEGDAAATATTRPSVVTSEMSGGKMFKPKSNVSARGSVKRKK